VSADYEAPSDVPNARRALGDDAESTRVQSAIRIRQAMEEATAEPEAEFEDTRQLPKVSAERKSRRAAAMEAKARAAEEQDQKKTTRQKIRGWATEIAIVIVLALVLSAVVRAFVFEMYKVPTGSMEDTIMPPNDQVVAVKLMGFERGDIVVFKDPGGWLVNRSDPERSAFRRFLEYVRVLPSSITDHLVKRVIGMPGDHVECCDALGRVMVNGTPLNEEAYLHATNGITDYPSKIQFDVWVPEGRIFVLGDHRDASRDSRFQMCGDDPLAAFVPIENVEGPVVGIGTPLSRIQRFKIPDAFADIPDSPTGSPPADPIVYCSLCP
jgi:signal peptidase I